MGAVHSSTDLAVAIDSYRYRSASKDHFHHGGARPFGISANLSI